LNLVPDDEWDRFLAALKEPLPVTFRVTGFRSHAFAVMHLIRERYFKPLESSTTIEKPKELVWSVENFSKFNYSNQINLKVSRWFSMAIKS
jgi:tRNA (cytosine34-C5)-methyltransferase